MIRFHGNTIRSCPPTPACCWVRIVVVHTETDSWCDVCALPTAVTLTYVVEPRGGVPSGVHRLTYCESCEDA
jgi:hypothetical protein